MRAANVQSVDATAVVQQAMAELAHSSLALTPMEKEDRMHEGSIPRQH